MGTEVMSSWDIPALADGDYLSASSVAIGSEQKYFFSLLKTELFLSVTF